MRVLILRILISVVLRTICFSVENGEVIASLLREKKAFVLVFWHGSMIWPWWYMRERNAAALVSMSRDGQLLAKLLQSWNYEVLRGSSSRGNREAMQAMREAVERGRILCVTPDGPRGPYHELKMGAVRVAQTMHVPMVMLSVGYKWCKRLKNWDRFEIPMPFTKCRVLFSDPIHIDPSLEGEALDEKRAELEKLMHAQYRIVTLEVEARE